MKVTSLIAKISSASTEERKALLNKILKSGSDYGIYPVTNEQKRMLFMHEFLTDSCIYNSRFMIKMTSVKHMNILQNAVKHMVDKHDIFRTMYFRIEGTYFQVPCAPNEYELKFDEIDLSEEYADDENEFIECINDMTNLPFDFAQEIPVRCLRVKATDELYFMIITFHHISIDGWSVGVIQNELNNYFSLASDGKQDKDEEPEYQYIDYALWQQTDEYKSLLSECREFWSSYLKNSEKSLYLPFEKDCNNDEDISCDYYDCFLTDDLNKKVRKWLKDTRKSMFNFMLTIFYMALFRFTSQDNINIGTPSDRRGQIC